MTYQKPEGRPMKCPDIVWEEAVCHPSSKNFDGIDEIVWEITTQCKHNCFYCGMPKSRIGNIKLTETPPETIEKILSEIAKYPPKQITISGGDPTLVPFPMHEKIVQTLRPLGTTVKIILSAKSLMGNDHILNLYDIVGVSLNDKEDIEEAVKYIHILDKPFIFLTNFNLLNLYNYYEIENVVKHFNKPWVVSATQFNEDHNLYSLFLFKPGNEAAAEDFDTKLTKTQKELGDRLILGDNINSVPCGAGTTTIGITSFGEVVPCLFQYSLCSDDCKNEMIEGTLLHEPIPLELIWKRKFNLARCKMLKCCKDFCHHKPPTPQVIPKTIPVTQIGPAIPQMPPHIIDDQQKKLNVYAYAVFDPWQSQRIVYTENGTIKEKDLNIIV